MAKDPALLFYTSDFLTGTMTMTNEHVGMYIRLLCLQHQKTWLNEKDMLHICGTYVEDVFSKFVKTEQGFYNERLRFEAERRNKYCESRKMARTSNVRGTYVQRMETETENIEKRIVKEKNTTRFIAPTIDEVRTYCAERKNQIDAERFVDHYTANGWSQGRGKPIKDWKAAVRNWEKNSFNNKGPETKEGW